MNSLQPNTSKKGPGREALGVAAKLLLIIVASFAFAAFSSWPTHPQRSADGGQAVAAGVPMPNHSR
jgi:hypothetical protein